MRPRLRGVFITNWCTTYTEQMEWKKQKQIILSAPTMMHFIRTRKAQILRRPNKIVFPPTKLLYLSKVNSDVSWHVDWRLYLGLPCVNKKCHLGNFRFSPSPSYLKIVWEFFVARNFHSAGTVQWHLTNHRTVSTPSRFQRVNSAMDAHN